MRHQKSGRKLSRRKEHRKAMLANLAASLIKNGRIQTTDSKAKEVRPFIERMVTFARRGDLHARRIVLSRLKDAIAVKKLFDEIGPQYTNRFGGYTRILKLGFRQGDNSPISLIEFVKDEEVKKSSKKQKSSKTKEKPAKAPEKPDETVDAVEAVETFEAETSGEEVLEEKTTVEEAVEEPVEAELEPAEAVKEAAEVDAEENSEETEKTEASADKTEEPTPDEVKADSEESVDKEGKSSDEKKSSGKEEDEGKK